MGAISTQVATEVILRARLPTAQAAVKDSEGSRLGQDRQCAEHREPTVVPSNEQLEARKKTRKYKGLRNEWRILRNGKLISIPGGSPLAGPRHCELWAALFCTSSLF